MEGRKEGRRSKKKKYRDRTYNVFTPPRVFFTLFFFQKES